MKYDEYMIQWCRDCKYCKDMYCYYKCTNSNSVCNTVSASTPACELYEDDKEEK